MIVAYPLQLNKYQDFKLLAQRLQKLGDKKFRKLAISNFLKNYSLKGCQLSKNSSMITFLTSFIGTQLRTRSLKILSYSDYICKCKSSNMDEDVLKLAINT